MSSLTGFRTIIAAAVALIAELLRLIGVEIDAAGQEGLVNSIVTVLGIISAIGFKVAANKREDNLEAQLQTERQS